MTSPSIASQVVTAIADSLKRDASTIQEHHRLREDLGLDSLAVVELLFKIEETFDLRIPDQDLPTLTTVGAVAAYVQKLVAQADPRAVPQPAPAPFSPL